MKERKKSTEVGPRDPKWDAWDRTHLLYDPKLAEQRRRATQEIRTLLHKKYGGKVN
jgi:hypothetical protein